MHLSALLSGLAATMLLASVAHADRVRLKNGSVVEGVVTTRGDEVLVRMDMGTVGFPQSEVVAIEKSRSRLGEFERRRKALTLEDVDARYRLGLWAEKQRLGSKARGLFREVVALSPDHKGARAALGYRRVGSAWMTEAEEMKAKGFVRRGAGWVSQEIVQAERVAAEQRRASNKQRQTEAKVDKLEADLAAVRAEAKAAREAAEARERPAAGGALYPYGWYAEWLPYPARVGNRRARARRVGQRYGAGHPRLPPPVGPRVRIRR